MFVVDVERSYDKPWLSSSKKVKAKSEDFSASKQGKKYFKTIFFSSFHVIKTSKAINLIGIVKLCVPIEPLLCK